MNLHIIVVNINNLDFTKNLIYDLLRQTEPFKLTLVDQGSKEEGTREYFNSLVSNPNINLQLNSENINLNHLWNNHYLNTNEPYLCFLNNDIRAPSNFVKDTVDIFEKEATVGCVVHSTNHPEYFRTSKLKYMVVRGGGFVQGWDFSVRRIAYSLIPEELDTFGGDDYLFNSLSAQGWRIALVLSSPIIHFKAMSHRYFEGDRNKVSENAKKYGLKRLPYRNLYSLPYPTFKEVKECL